MSYTNHSLVELSDTNLKADSDAESLIVYYPKKISMKCLDLPYNTLICL